MPDIVSERETAPDELRRHHDVGERLILDDDGRRRIVDRVLDTDTLDWLWRRDLLTWEQYAAGRRLRADVMSAGMIQLRAGRVMRVETSTRSGPASEPEGRLDARDRIRSAMRVVGRARSSMLLAIVVAGERLTDVERAMSRPRGTALALLCSALDDLSDHYEGERQSASGRRAA